ncbi:beta-lactamase-like protein [Mycena polygramma]|nr:beta-lactamase-like protein [Mycena polygramma]
MSFRELGIPTAEATVSLTAFDVVSSPRAVNVPAAAFMQPVLEGHATFHSPVFAFLVVHAASGRRVLFDLGPRKDMENAAPGIAEAVKAGFIVMPVERDIVEQLADNGVDLDSISAVIWSHGHIDHVGAYDSVRKALKFTFEDRRHVEIPCLDRACVRWVDGDRYLSRKPKEGRKLVPINFDESQLVGTGNVKGFDVRPPSASPQLEIAGFRARNFFGDGSFYLLDVPGHLSGHVAALARVTPTSFVLLGGDTCHHAGMLRPTAKLHRHSPCPGELLAATRRSVSAVHFPPPNAVGEFDLAARTVPMLDVAENGYYEEPPTARASIAKLGDVDANRDIFVVLAHDESLGDVVGLMHGRRRGGKSAPLGHSSMRETQRLDLTIKNRRRGFDSVGVDCDVL